MDIHSLFPNAKISILFLCLVGISIFLGYISHVAVYKLLGKYYPSTDSPARVFFRHLKGPLYIIFPLLYIEFASSLWDNTVISQAISLIVKIFIIVAVSWSTLRLIDYFVLWLIRRQQTKGYKGIITRAYLLKKIAKVMVFILTVSVILLSFDSVKEIGKGIIFSAGIIGGVAVLGAQKLFGNIISGFQLAFATPLQIGDFVKVEGQLGNIEEITLTYIIVRTWDLRKLVVPLSYLMEKPFENWSQLKDSLLGTVFFYTDYYIDASKIREALMQLLQSTDLWDKKVGKLEVTNINEKALELRALVSARDASALWNLQCYVREKLMAFISKEYPYHMPKFFATQFSPPQVEK